MLEIRSDKSIVVERSAVIVQTLKELVNLRYKPDYWKEVVSVDFTFRVSRENLDLLITELLNNRGKVITIVDTVGYKVSCDPDVTETTTYEGIINSDKIEILGTGKPDCALFTMRFKLLGQVVVV